MTKRYVMIGCGFVSPRHMKAIKETGGKLLAILDPYDSVGIIDSYFPDTFYFREYERFDRFCLKNDIDYCVVCSPNYLHSSHSIFGLRVGTSVICEKPLCLNPKNIDQLREAEEQYGGKIYSILQLRLSPLIWGMKSVIKKENEVDITYFTPRGNWYDYSWKGSPEKSGTITFNIGIHLFDLLLYLFGNNYEVLFWEQWDRNANGKIKIGNSEVSIMLSIDKHREPTRIFEINGQEFDLSQNFGDLHTLSYQKILEGNGFGIDTVTPAIKLCSELREI